MKKFSNLLESKAELDIQEDSINFIDSAQLQKYLDVLDKFLAPEAKSVIKYLIAHNNTYIKDFTHGSDDNALVSFYNYSMPKTDEEKQLKGYLTKLNKEGKILQVPVFQTEEQFNALVNKEVAPDKILLDITTEQGRNKIAQAYQPLIHKICNQFLGKSNLDYDDLYSAAQLGLVYAMNNYGKKTDKNKVGEEKINTKTFTQYAAEMIRFCILEDIKNVSRTVRVATSELNRERAETGKNAKSNTISGDKEVGHSKDDGTKTLFDFIGDTDVSTRGIDQEDLDRLWAKLYKELETKFEPQVLEIFYSKYGLNGHKKLQTNEMAKKYNMVPSNITYYCSKVIRTILKDPKLKSLVTDIYELFHECLDEMDFDHDPYEPSHLNINEENNNED